MICLRNMRNLFGLRNVKLANELIKKAHHHFDHIGADKLKMILRPKFYFVGFDKLIDAFCSTCVICIKNKSRQKRLIGFMHNFSRIEEPYKMIS